MSETKYLTYTPWQGQLNNTRMCFETALVLAYLTRRSLVMPAEYRREHEPDVEADRFRPLHPGECFALETLNGIVPMLGRSEYDLMAMDLSGRGQVDLVFKPETMVFCYPSIPDQASAEASRLREFAVFRRGFLEITPEMDACGTLNMQSPTLEQFYAFFYFRDATVATECKRFIRDHVKFKPAILCAAERIAGALGNYCALHVRRNDFFGQYPQQNVPPDRLLRNIMERVPPSTRLYIATDEADKSFFGVLREAYQVHFLDDFTGLFPDQLPAGSRACVEQMVCALARLFIGTKLSTFSAYVTRLRGYYGATDQNVYFTDGSPGSEMDEAGSPPFSWINWVRSGNPLWGREFKEGWDLDEQEPVTS